MYISGIRLDCFPFIVYQCKQGHRESGTLLYFHYSIQLAAYGIKSCIGEKWTTNEAHYHLMTRLPDVAWS